MSKNEKSAKNRKVIDLSDGNDDKNEEKLKKSEENSKISTKAPSNSKIEQFFPSTNLTNKKRQREEDKIDKEDPPKNEGKINKNKKRNCIK